MLPMTSLIFPTFLDVFAICDLSRKIGKNRGGQRDIGNVAEKIWNHEKLQKLRENNRKK